MKLTVFEGGLLLAMIGGAFAVMAAHVPATPARYEVQALDQSGNLYIAGSGETCNDAWRGAVYPDNVATVKCVRAR